MSESRQLHLAWVMLLLATGVTSFIGETGGLLPSGLGMAVLMLLTLMKGSLVIQVFLEMRRAPMLWRWLLLGWLGVVVALIGLAYWLASR